MAAAPQAARRPRIVNPVNGSVYAIDPDIPADRQRLAVTVSGAVAGHRPILDKRPAGDEIGRESCRERVCQYVLNAVVAVSLKKQKSHTPQYIYNHPPQT